MFKMEQRYGQEDFDPTIDFNDNGVDDGALGKKMEESHDKALANLEDNSGTRLSNSRRA